MRQNRKSPPKKPPNRVSNAVCDANLLNTIQELPQSDAAGMLPLDLIPQAAPFWLQNEKLLMKANSLGDLVHFANLGQ